MIFFLTGNKKSDKVARDPRTGKGRLLITSQAVRVIMCLFDRSLKIAGVTLYIQFVEINKLNCFIGFKRFIHISYHILDCIQQKKTKLTM